jgi:type IV pilus assembly protein PilP
MKKFFTYSILLLLISLMAGCADTEPQKVVAPHKVTKPAPETKVKDAAPAEPKEPSTGIAAYDYNPQGRRDPFTSLILKDVAEKKKGVGPLEQDDIKTFRLIAIVKSGDQYNAMITLPDGKSYTVKKGMKIGIDGGTIESITKDSVVVRQLIKDKTGVLKPKDIILRLRTEDEG